MSGLDFGSFLEKMSGETSGRRKQSINEGAMKRGGTKPQTSTPRPPVKPKPQKIMQEEYEEYDEEEYDNEYKEPEVKKPQRETLIDEDFMDKAYDYAQGIVKVVRTNFKSTEERVVMFQAIQKAVSYYLQSVGQKPVQNIHSLDAPMSSEASTPDFFSGPRMTESEWNNIPSNKYDQTPGSVKMNDLSGQVVESTPPPTNGKYNPRLNLGIKIAPDGKQEADLSGVTPQDINEMRMLAGMIGPEAEKKAQELAAAKQEVAAKIQEKQNQ